MAITQREAQQIEEANASGRTAVVLIHGLVAAAEQLGPLEGSVRRGRVRDADPFLAG
jgi:hypothetical protein